MKVFEFLYFSRKEKKRKKGTRIELKFRLLSFPLLSLSCDRVLSLSLPELISE